MKKPSYFTGLLLALLTIAIGAPVEAQIPAVSVINQSGGDHSPNTFGWEFTVGPKALTVTDLGYWDEGSDGLVTTHEVGIWELSTETLVGSTVVNAGTTDPIDAAGWRYNNQFSSFQLSANTTYVIGAMALRFNDNIGFLAGLDVDNVTPAPGIAAFVIGRFSSANSFAFPNNPSGEGRYFGPNFRFLEDPVGTESKSVGAVKSAFRRGSQ